MKNILHMILAKRHFWRYASFGDIAELYASRTLRMAAIYIVGSFMSIYMFQLGYGLVLISFFWAAYYFYKSVLALPLAALIGRIGPKRSVLVSNILYIPSMICYALLPEFGAWLLVPILLLQGFSSALYDIAYAIDFSKVKSSKNAGKEISYMNIFEKITTGVSPLIGGFLAFVAGPQVVIIISSVLFALASVPLFMTGERVKTGIKLKFKAFPWRLLFRHSLAQAAYGFDLFVSGTAWLLFVATAIVGMGSDNEVYAVTGILLSVVLVVAVVSSFAFGRMIDRRKGRELMQFGAIGKMLSHLARPFVSSPVIAGGLNAVNEVSVTGYVMPYTRAVFDNADLSGARTTYLGFNELLLSLGSALGGTTLGLLALALEEKSALVTMFFLAAAVSLLMLTARFPLYKK